MHEFKHTEQRSFMRLEWPHSHGVACKCSCFSFRTKRGKFDILLWIHDNPMLLNYFWGMNSTATIEMSYKKFQWTNFGSSWTEMLLLFGLSFWPKLYEIWIRTYRIHYSIWFGSFGSIKFKPLVHPNKALIIFCSTEIRSCTSHFIALHSNTLQNVNK